MNTKYCKLCGRERSVDEFIRRYTCNRDHDSVALQEQKPMRFRKKKRRKEIKHEAKIVATHRKYENARSSRAPRRVTQYKGSRLPLDMRGNPTRSEYAQYLKSEHWKEFRESYYGSGRDINCFVCEGDENIELHHHTYIRLYSEKLDDVVPLCKSCHKKTHKLVTNGMSLSTAHRYLKGLWDRGDNGEVTVRQM